MTSITTTNSRKRFLGSKKHKAEVIAKENALKEKEILSVKQILIAALDLCERNSSQLQQQPKTAALGSQLWFNVLDRLIHAKGFLRLSKELPEHALFVSAVTSELLQLTMQRMVSNIALKDLVNKITMDQFYSSGGSLSSVATSEHSSCHLGELREMVSCMLKTYRLELNVCENALEVMHYDVGRMSMKKRGLEVHGIKVKSFMDIALGDGKLLSTDEKNEGVSFFIKQIIQKPKSLLHINSTGQACLSSYQAEETNTPISKQANFGKALARLEKERFQRRVDTQCGFLQLNRPSIPMTIASEQKFMKGRPQSFGELGFQQQYKIGRLSAAEHYGRLD